MPEVDGFEAARRIRSGDAGQMRQFTPIIALTAGAMQGDREKCLEAGMDDYISKPVDTVELVDKLDKWLQGRVAAAQGRDSALAPDAADSPEGASVLDLAELTDRVMGNDDVVREVLCAFIHDTPIRLAALKASLASGDMEDATLQSHSIKGAASTVSAGRVRDVALEIEQVCRSGAGAQKALPMVPSLEKEFEALRALAHMLGHVAAA